MQNPTRIPELVHRERFIKRVLTSGVVSFVAGDQGCASVPFRHDPRRDVVLFWSSRADAERWADVVATDPMVHALTLGQFLAEVLPMLTQRDCLIGPDWSTDPSDPVIETSDLAERIWRERTEHFLSARRTDGCLWLLESASGPAFLPSKRMAGKSLLPVWGCREHAASHATGDWAVKRPISVSLAVFRDRYLPYLEQRGWFVGAEPLPEAGAREMSPSEFGMGLFPSQTLARLRAV